MDKRCTCEHPSGLPEWNHFEARVDGYLDVIGADGKPVCYVRPICDECRGLIQVGKGNG